MASTSMSVRPTSRAALSQPSSGDSAAAAGVASVGVMQEEAKAISPFATPTVTMLPRAGVRSPKRWRNSTARASLCASSWLLTSSRSSTWAAVSPKTAALSRSQARAAATGSADVASARTPSAGQDRGRRTELVPAEVDRVERTGRGLLGGGRPRGAAAVEVGQAGGGVAPGHDVVGGDAFGRGGSALRDRRELGEPRDERDGEQGGSGEGMGGPAGPRAVWGGCHARHNAAARHRLCEAAARHAIRTSAWIVHIIGATVLRCVRSDVSPSVLSCPRRWPPSATSPATSGGPGTRRPRTSSRPSTPSSGSRPGATRSGCSAPSTPAGSRSWRPTARSSTCSRRRRPTSTTT